MKETKAVMMDGVPDAVKSKLIANNTIEYFKPDGVKVIRLHHTDIISFSSDGRTITLDTGGWKTVTTKERINRYLPSGLRVYSDRGLWYLYGPFKSPDSGDWSRDRVPFFDGMQIKDAKLPKPKLSKERADARLRDRILKFVKKLDALKELPFPSAGDCFFCQMSASAKQVSIGGHQATQYFGQSDARVRPAMRDINPHHLLEHIREGYLHGSLLVNAMRWAGYPDRRIAMELDPRFRRSGYDQVKNTLRRYLRAQLGL